MCHTSTHFRSAINAINLKLWLTAGLDDMEEGGGGLT